MRARVLAPDAYFLTRPIGRLGRSIWQLLPTKLREQPPGRWIGSCIHTLTRKLSRRRSSRSTWFLRNPPLLLTVGDALNQCKFGDPLRLCVIGCSSGAEVYSAVWAIRQARSDLKILVTGIDLSESCIERAKAGRYSLQDPELRGELSGNSLAELFEVDQGNLRIKSSIAAGIVWIAGDACDDRIRATIGLQDVVFANNFLVHLREADAVASLRKVVELVVPGGLLVCRGVDLNVRERVTRQSGFQPVATRIEEIHNAESHLDARLGWPWNYWGLEPLNKRRGDWVWRYAAIFQRHPVE